MWVFVQVIEGQTVHRGRFRAVGGTVELEWRGGRCVEKLGPLKPEFAAQDCLRRQVQVAQRELRRLAG